MTEIITYIILLALSAFLYWVTYSFPSFGITITGPATFPRMVLVFLAIMALLLLVNVLRKKGQGGGRIPVDRSQVGFLVLSIALCITTSYVGFFVSAPVFLLACMAWFIGSRRLGNVRTLANMVLSTAVTIGVIWYVFAVKLDLIFP
jgi:hypothetical protein